MLYFDYKCPKCPRQEERAVKQGKQDNQKCECGAMMKRLPAGTRTTFRFADARYRA